MINCKYTPGREVPISFQLQEDFKNRDSDSFFLCKMISGYIVLQINNQIFHIASDALFCFPRETEIKVLASCRFKAVSISFSPEFMNVHLNWDFIEAAEYPSMVQEFQYPSFDLFYKRNMLYQGILPLEPAAGSKINKIFQETITLLDEQPHTKWSCDARTNLFSLFEMAEHFCREFRKGSDSSDLLEANILNYIHLNLCTKITIETLCQEFHTNHTTIQNKFQAYTGRSIAEYIIEKRLSLAQHALAFTHLSIEKISEKVGYENVSYFATLFKKRIGITPTSYRTEMRKKRANFPKHR